MMIHNFVKYFVQTLEILEILEIFISHKRSRVWTRYFTKLCIIVSSTCVLFLVNLDDLFAVVCTVFHEVVGVSGANHNLRENPCKPQQNNPLNSPKKSHM